MNLEPETEKKTNVLHLVIKRKTHSNLHKYAEYFLFPSAETCTTPIIIIAITPHFIPIPHLWMAPRSRHTNAAAAAALPEMWYYFFHFFSVLFKSAPLFTSVPHVFLCLRAHPLRLLLLLLRLRDDDKNKEAKIRGGVFCKLWIAKLVALEFIFPPLSFQSFCNHLFRLFDKSGRGYLVQEEWICSLKQNTR